ncbi:MAG: tRNA (guanosine(37)-N1)-methyltransferase TrmD [Gammaproteobacteria bacterium]|nr:tRNA (guanosine(37)-N1)-methyltransferase TrmD [Gammaproteobacteria bacterium]
MFEALSDYGVLGRAVERHQLQLNFWNPRDFTEDRHQTVDDRSYGGGPGMVMKVEPLQRAITAARGSAGGAPRVVYLTPQGLPLTQKSVVELSQEPGLILLAGRYEGIDERLIELEVTDEFSVGDYVVSGGELPAMVLIDAVARLIPGVLGHGESAKHDSFMDGLLDFPHYTRPEIYQGLAVPPLLLSGDHGAVDRWRLRERLGRTQLRRPDLVEALDLTSEQQQLLSEYLALRGGGREDEGS